MIHSFVHPGSGLGNQLHRIIAGKALAQDKGYIYSAVGREYFKGSGFMVIDFGPDNQLLPFIERPAGKLYIPGLAEEVVKNGNGFEFPRLWEEKTNYYNPEFNFIENNTIIDGEFQDERYFEKYMGSYPFVNSVDQWLKAEPLEMPDDVCVIGFRGGEFYLYPELGLPETYFLEGIEKMRKINPDMKFEVHTDDEVLAKVAFPDFKVIHDIGINWRSMRYAKYAIIANSSFYILPRLLNKGLTIAPRYWARRNTKEWSMPQNYYKCFTYL